MSGSSNHGRSARSSDSEQPYFVNRSSEPASNDTERPLAEMRKNVNDVLRILYVHRWAFLVPCCAAATLVFVLSLSYPRTYTATTSFERRNDPVVMNLQLREGTGSFALWRSTMRKDLTSVRVVGEAIEHMGLTEDFPRDENGQLTEAGSKKRDALASTLGSRISVVYRGPNEHIDFVTLTYVGPDPLLGRELLQEVKKAYIRWTEERIQDLLEDQHEYFTAQAKEAFTQLQQARRKLIDIQLENPLVDPDNPSLIVAEITQREMERKNLELRRREYEAELATELDILDALDDPERMQQAATGVQAAPAREAEAGEKPQRRVVRVTESKETKRLRAEMARLTDEITKLKATRGMTDAHPDIVERRQQLDWLQEQLTKQRERDLTTAVASRQSEDTADQDKLASTIVSTANDNAAAQLERERRRGQLRVRGIEEKIREVDLSIDANEERVGMLDDARKSMHEVREKCAAAREVVNGIVAEYNSLQRNASDLEPAMRANAAGKLCKFIDQHQASGGLTPVSPKLATIIMMAIMIGVGTGAIFILLAEVFDNIIRSSHQVSRTLGIPILESIDEIVTARDKRRRLIRRTVLLPILMVVGVGSVVTSGTMAYLSLERPWTYEKIKHLPEKAKDWLATSIEEVPADSLPSPTVAKAPNQKVEG